MRELHAELRARRCDRRARRPGSGARRPRCGRSRGRGSRGRCGRAARRRSSRRSPCRRRSSPASSSAAGASRWPSRRRRNTGTSARPRCGSGNRASPMRIGEKSVAVMAIPRLQATEHIYGFAGCRQCGEHGDLHALPGPPMVRAVGGNHGAAATSGAAPGHDEGPDAPLPDDRCRRRASRRLPRRRRRAGGEGRGHAPTTWRARRSRRADASPRRCGAAGSAPRSTSPRRWPRGGCWRRSSIPIRRICT